MARLRAFASTTYFSHPTGSEGIQSICPVTTQRYLVLVPSSIMEYPEGELELATERVLYPPLSVTFTTDPAVSLNIVRVSLPLQHYHGGTQ